MSQKPDVIQLLPLEASDDPQISGRQWDQLYEPDAQPLLHALPTRFTQPLVYQGLVDDIAADDAARMVAVKSAKGNAGSTTDELQLVYNKARQAAITQEMSEIVSGAAAV